MAKIKGAEAAREVLAETEKRLRAWREGRRRGQRIPRELWLAAEQLCEHFSLAEVAGRLALNYERLEKRVEAGRGQRPEQQRKNAPIRGTGFVEVARLGDGCPDACTIEADDGRGAKLAVRLSGGACVHAAEIVKALRGGRR